jgi:hypothetical protein
MKTLNHLQLVPIDLHGSHKENVIYFPKNKCLNQLQKVAVCAKLYENIIVKKPFSLMQINESTERKWLTRPEYNASPTTDK